MIDVGSADVLRNQLVNCPTLHAFSVLRVGLVRGLGL